MNASRSALGRERQVRQRGEAAEALARARSTARRRCSARRTCSASRTMPSARRCVRYSACACGSARQRLRGGRRAEPGAALVEQHDVEVLAARARATPRAQRALRGVAGPAVEHEQVRALLVGVRGGADLAREDLDAPAVVVGRQRHRRSGARAAACRGPTARRVIAPAAAARRARGRRAGSSCTSTHGGVASRQRAGAAAQQLVGHELVDRADGRAEDVAARARAARARRGGPPRARRAAARRTGACTSARRARARRARRRGPRRGRSARTPGRAASSPGSAACRPAPAASQSGAAASIASPIAARSIARRSASYAARKHSSLLANCS